MFEPDELFSTIEPALDTTTITMAMTMTMTMATAMPVTC